MRGLSRVMLWLCAAAVVLLLPTGAYAQVGNIAGTVRDVQGNPVPGVTVEASSPQLIEKVRSAVTDAGGRFQIVSLPVGTYKVTFGLQGFNRVERENIPTSSDVTTTVNAELKPGDFKEVVNVTAEANLIDIRNAKQTQVLTGDEIKDLPTSRNLSDLMQLVPGISITAGDSLNSTPRICSGGVADPSGQIFNAGSTGTGSRLGFGVSGATFADSGSTSGSLSGCSPLVENFNSHTSMNDSFGLSQGRVQIDGMGIQSFGGGGRSSYVADIANSQEISFTLSGSLGESETGGATINIIPRTGGNRYAGNFFTSYGDGKFFGKNNETRTSTYNNRLDYQFDVNGSYGGPILKDRLWFQSNARMQERHNILRTSYRNVNQGVFGANYVGDPNSPVMQSDKYQNVSLRLTIQASQKNKFNVSWDEQYTCDNPCQGTSGGGVSLEASPSSLTYPLHVAQISWNNPLTNRILLDAGVSHYSSHRNLTRNRYEPEYPGIPTIVEDGTTIARVSTSFGAMTSGSINDTDNWNVDNIQSRASASYVTGSHNVKLGYQGGYMSRATQSHYNDARLEYFYQTQAGTCSPIAPAPNTVSGLNATWCGFLPDGRRAYDGRNANDTIGSIVNGQVVELPFAPGSVSAANQTQRMNYLIQTGYVTQGPTVAGQPSFTSTMLRPPVPRSVTQFIPFPTDEHTWFGSLYLQDQWTIKRFTFNGALRYDLARSGFNKTCVGPDAWEPVELSYCMNDGGPSGSGKGVDFQDITPRWGVAWDVFGNGKTSVKWNMGKYLGGASVGGIFTAMNPAQIGRSTNTYTRGWLDLDGDRLVDCDLSVPLTPPAGSLPTNGECGGEEVGTVANARRFGRDPYDYNQADSDALIGTQQFYCGQPGTTTREDGSVIRLANQRVIDYCDNYAAAGGESLISGWGQRAYEWQFGLGIQHELLPRLSVEVTYNRRWGGNRVLNDSVNVTTPTGSAVYVPNGCDLYSVQAGGATDADACMTNLLANNSPFYDFYGIQAPIDPRLPNGGGYVVSGIPIQKVTQTGATNVTVNTLDFTNRVLDYWSGVDMNATMRARGGLRLNGGFSTGRRIRDACNALVDNPPSVTLRAGNELACDAVRPYQMNVRGSATYTVPWVDVLVSTTFSYRPGTQINATYTTDRANVIWGPYSQGSTAITTQTVSTNLLSNDTFGEGIRLFDIRLAKNVRFSGKRVNIGADVYNAFNSDAAVSYCATYPQCAAFGTTPAQSWQQVTGITTPRYVRFQVQFDF